jgi:hypothetical protein
VGNGDTINFSTYSGDIGWIVNSGFGLSSGAFFDRSTPNKLWVPSDVGPIVLTWSGSVGSSTFVSAIVTGRGLEQLVGNAVLSVPGRTPPLTLSWDFGVRNLINFNAYPAYFGPNFPQFAAAWSGDIATSDGSNRAVVYADGTYIGAGNQSGYTDDGINWTSFAGTVPAGSGFGGSIAASTQTNWLLNTNLVQQPNYTTNAGLGWTPVNLESVANIPNIYTVTGGSYTSSTGVVSLTLSAAPGFTSGATFQVSGLSGAPSAAESSFGTWFTAASVSGSTVTYVIATGLGNATFGSGGTLNGWYGLGAADFWVGKWLAADKGQSHPKSICHDDGRWPQHWFLPDH